MWAECCHLVADNDTDQCPLADHDSLCEALQRYK